MFYGEKIVESVRSSCTPEEGELLTRLPVELKLIELKPYGSKKLFGKHLDPDLAGPIQKVV